MNQEQNNNLAVLLYESIMYLNAFGHKMIDERFRRAGAGMIWDKLNRYLKYRDGVFE